ncbi:MAG: hypothetical protein C5B49_11560 [Bdellovibrio sp.]|nr:MAG: hypothetical protein C5B49_11560 [Bdellovibrio sp.]
MWVLFFILLFQVSAQNSVSHLEPIRIESVSKEDEDSTGDCKVLAKTIATANKKFPLPDIKSLKELVTWRASRCEKAPKGDGVVTQLCDADLASGKWIFFWEKKAKRGKLIRGFFICD